MHVLYLVGTGEGGLPHYAAELANAVSEDHDVTVLKPEETEADGLFSDRVTVLEPFVSLGISMSKLVRLDVDLRTFLRGMWSYHNMDLIKDLDPDVVHEVTDLFPHVKFFTRYYGIDREYPFVVTRHEVPMSRLPFSRPAVLVEELVNAALPDVRTDRYIVHTEKQREALRRRGVDPRTVEVIPHGAYSVFGNHELFEGTPDPNSLLFFGNLIKQKGVDTLIEAVPLIKQEIPDVKVRLSGDGQIPRRVRGIVSEHREIFDIDDRFIPNDEVSEHFARSELIVLPYRDQDGTKGHSGVLSAAFSFGKPVVASTAGEFPELIEEAGCGVVVPPDDPERLANAIVETLSDERAKQEMAERSKEMADRLSWSMIASQHVDVYRRVLDGGRPAKHRKETAPPSL